MTTPPASAREGSHWPKCATSAAIFRDGEVLLIERGRGALAGRWSLPGGHIEPGETARAAALREVAEETGVSAELDGLVDVHDVILRRDDGSLRVHYLLAVFCGRWRAGEARPGPDERSARFVRIADLGAYRLTDGAADLIRRAWVLVQSAGR
jgi:ADP-ribose pyrophosphatase YjhB (NUDIX family)